MVWTSDSLFLYWWTWRDFPCAALKMTAQYSSLYILSLHDANLSRGYAWRVWFAEFFLFSVCASCKNGHCCGKWLLQPPFHFLLVQTAPRLFLQWLAIRWKWQLCHFPSAHLFPVGKEQKWYDNTRVTGAAANLQEPVDWMNSTHLLVDNIGSYVHKEAGGRFRLCTPESTSVRFLFILENGSLT